MPLGGFAASYEMMNTLTFNPVLGHITTFGGHPVCCAAGMAAMEYILKNRLMEQVEEKSKKKKKRLISHKSIKEIRRAGLMIAVDFGNNTYRDKVVAKAVEKGIVTEGFLFCDTAMRIAPPLTITTEQIEEISAILLQAMDEADE